jgi:hypothetical protein
LLCLSACASRSSAPGGPCAERVGAYRLSYLERSGNCGALSEQIIVLGHSDAGADDPCKGPVTETDDACTVTVDVTCPNKASNAPDSVLEERGSVRWTKDGVKGSGVLQMLVTTREGVEICSSTYDVTYIRQ